MSAGIKGTCPICLRTIALCDDRSLMAHNKRASRKKTQEPEPCNGSGQQPLDQFRIAIPSDAPFASSSVR